MREILFKAKGQTDDKWHIGFLANLYGGICIIRENEHEWICKPETICQCTGLKDKNGKLIWENDVVKIEEHEDTVNGLYKVIYCENAHCYALERSADFHYNFFTFSDLNGFETSSKVIGNIFDNPELLGSEE